MELLAALALGWTALSFLGVLGAAAVCRGGHAEDVARGYSETGDPRALRQVTDG
jgi:hypothetical protein